MPSLWWVFRVLKTFKSVYFFFYFGTHVRGSFDGIVIAYAVRMRDWNCQIKARGMHNLITFMEAQSCMIMIPYKCKMKICMNFSLPLLDVTYIFRFGPLNELYPRPHRLKSQLRLKAVWQNLEAWGQDWRCFYFVAFFHYSPWLPNSRSHHSQLRCRW